MKSVILLVLVFAAIFFSWLLGVVVSESLRKLLTPWWEKQAQQAEAERQLRLHRRWEEESKK